MKTRIKEIFTHYEYIMEKSSPNGYSTRHPELVAPKRGVYKITGPNPLIYNDLPTMELVEVCNSYYDAKKIMSTLERITNNV